MNRRQRLEAAVTGGQPDRVPVSAWGHFYSQETSAQGLADVMLDFFQRYDWDFLKVHARASYHVEGWGFSYQPSTDPAKLHVCTGHPIDSAAAWSRLKPLPLDTPALAEQVEAIRLIRKRIADDVPLIMTVFSPLDSAEKLVDRNAALLKAHIDEAPDAVEQGLAAIADTFERFMKLLVAEGVDGIYFSTKWANNAKLTSAQYQRLVRPFDLQVLEPARGLWCNILHRCEDAVQLQAMADYPVQVFHWDEATPNNPKLVDGQRLLGKAVGGGVDAPTLARGTPEQILAKARGVIRAQQGRNLVLGPGCSVQVAATSDANLRALRQAVEL
jgi:uroporphyrinogen decarboxylase